MSETGKCPDCGRDATPLFALYIRTDRGLDHIGTSVHCAYCNPPRYQVDPDKVFLGVFFVFIVLAAWRVLR